MIIAILWERHALLVVDTFPGVRIPLVEDTFLVVRKSLVGGPQQMVLMFEMIKRM
jgi:hypothetical protein